MKKLTESIQDLQSAIKLQENSITNADIAETQLIPNKEFSDEPQTLHQLSEEQLQFKFRPHMNSGGSEISQVSHWSCSLDAINSTITDLTIVLRNQEKQVLYLTTENEELKEKLKEKDEKIKKQTFLLKAEREMFYQYKKDIVKKGNKRNSENEKTQPTKANKKSQQILKLKSELSHYKQLYLEECHIRARLSKLNNSLKDEKTELKIKFLNQEKRSNKFIMDMAQRFHISRKEFDKCVSKKFESLSLSPSHLLVIQVVDRNAHLAYDNSMLKWELDELQQNMFEKKSQENELQHLFTRLPVLKPYSEQNLTGFTDKHHEQLKIINGPKSSVSLKSGLTKIMPNKNANAVKTSVTYLIERNFDSVSTLDRLVDKKDCMKLKLQQDCATGSSEEGMDVLRTESAPQLQSQQSKQEKNRSPK